MNKNKAELLGLLCSDGYSSDKWYGCLSFDKRRGRHYYRYRRRKVIEFGNKDSRLLERFQFLINKEYGYIPNILTKSQVTPRIVLGRVKPVDELTSYSQFGCERWIIPDCIVNGSDEIKFRFIKGFFDGDGTYSRGEPRIYSANKKSLFNLYELLEKLNISCTFLGPRKTKGKKDMYEIYIRAKSRQRFITLVAPIKCKPVSHSF